METSLDARKTDNSPPQPRQRITPRALLEIKRLSRPRIHPDGRRVAFVVTEADWEESRWVSHLWLTEWLPPDEAEAEAETPHGEETLPQTGESGDEVEGEEEGGEEDVTRQLTFSHEGESHPKWSPDGRYLAFLSARPDESEPLPEDEDDEEPKEQVWILPIEGGEARKLTGATEGVIEFEWTPDSKAIVFLAPEPRPRPIESVRKERIRQKNDPVVEHEERLRKQFWRVDMEERKPKRLCTADYGVSEFVLSPDGSRLCYATNYTGEWNDYHLVDLFVLELATGATVKLVERPGGKTHPRWSPDGTQIAFLSWLDPNFSYSRHTLFVAAVSESLEGATPSPAYPLTADTFNDDINEFAWSRHDGALYAIAAVRTQSEIYAITAEAATRLERANTTAELEEIDADTESGTLVFVQETDTALPEICLRDPDGVVYTLTKLNAEFAETYRLPRQEVVRWTSPDGTPVEGVLTYPLDYAEGTRVPLIVQIHGGPKGRATNTLRSYSMPPVWAAEGYAVLQPNFRGSEGYGNAFALANRRDLGGGDFADIMAGVDWCLARGIADPERLGVMGGSYGGFMTNWAIGHTDRFRAAVSMFGIFHLQTDYSNSELSRWDNEYLGAYYWEDPEIYRRLSPGSYIENIKTPTLILHGDEDNNTFISNSKELYQALRHRGVTAQFVHYPREGHGLGEPNHKLDELRRCLAWMDRYVRHGGQNPGLYRIGDKVPSADGLLELCVTNAEIATFLGQPKPEPTATPAEETALLEIAFTLHNLDSRQPVAPLTLSLESVRLEVGVGKTPPRPSPSQGEGATPPQPSPSQEEGVQNSSPPPYEGGGRGEVVRADLTPLGVPFHGTGGKALVEGENLRLVQHPDAETGQLAFTCAVVFRVGKEASEGRLSVADFPPVAVHWDGGENQEKTRQESAAETANDLETLPG